MKKIIIIFIVTISFLLMGGFWGFFFYAKAPTLSQDDYYQFMEYGDNYGMPKDTLIFASYNIGYLSGMTNNLPVAKPLELYKANMDRAVRVLGSLNADLIALQEIDFDSDRSYNQDQLTQIIGGIGYPLMYRSVNWDKTYMPFPYWPVEHHFKKIVSGQAIISRYPMTKPETILLEKPENSPFLYNYFYIDRLVQMVDWKIGTKVIHVMNVHLEAFDEETREKQAKVVKELFEAYADRPVILLGDFNSSPEYEDREEKAMKIIMSATNIKSAVAQADYEANKNRFYTFSSEEPYVMIDHILYNDKFLTCFDARVVHEAESISDHLPIVTKIVFK
jgi:endonuclease/exonuclease/phosphatase family metal-dependent hydrolase